MKKSYGLPEKDIIGMQVWCTSHKTYFQQSKSSRITSLNAHYLVVFQSPRDRMQIQVFANQLHTPHMVHAFTDVTSVPHRYLLIGRFETEYT